MKSSQSQVSSLVAAVLLLSTLVSAQSNVVRKPLVIGTKIETGQVVQGVANKTGGDPDGSYLSRMGVSLTQETIIDDRFEVKAGVGGVFFSLFPDVPGQAGSQGIKFGPGITQAQAAYKAGDIGNPWGIFRAGFFPYKYNPDAKNLGEYLFRSMPYPTFVMTGGWAITDNAFARLQGLQATIFGLDGKLKTDFLLTSERDFRPAGNFTPTAVTQYTTGAFQVGAGVSFFHFLPLDSDRLKSKGNMGDYAVYRYSNIPSDTLFLDTQTGDSLDVPLIHNGGELYMAKWEVSSVQGEWSTLNWDSLHATRDTMEYNTQGIKVMAHASFNIQHFMPLPFLNPNDLKVYGEAILLGVENQPVMYENRLQRIPVMLGINLPTFKMLDYLSFEVEYFNSPLPDDWERVQYENIPAFEEYSIVLRDLKKDKYKTDDWKWSLYASKTVATGLSIRGQIANDHFRSIDQATLNFAGRPSLRNPSDWYYIVALNFGI